MPYLYYEALSALAFYCDISKANQSEFMQIHTNIKKVWTRLSEFGQFQYVPDSNSGKYLVTSKKKIPLHTQTQIK